MAGMSVCLVRVLRRRHVCLQVLVLHLRSLTASAEQVKHLKVRKSRANKSARERGDARCIFCLKRKSTDHGSQNFGGLFRVRTRGAERRCSGSPCQHRGKRAHGTRPARQTWPQHNYGTERTSSTHPQKRLPLLCLAGPPRGEGSCQASLQDRNTLFEGHKLSGRTSKLSTRLQATGSPDSIASEKRNVTEDKFLPRKRDIDLQPRAIGTPQKTDPFQTRSQFQKSDLKGTQTKCSARTSTLRSQHVLSNNIDRSITIFAEPLHTEATIVPRESTVDRTKRRQMSIWSIELCRQAEM